MPDHVPTAQQGVSRRTLVRWLMLPGGFFLFFGLYISAFLIPDVIKAISGPQALTLEAAAEVAGEEQTYARLEDGAWDCDTLTPVRGLAPAHRRYELVREETKFTEIFWTDDTGEIVVFVTLSGEVECDDLAGEVPSGYLYTMNNATRRELTNDARLARFIAVEHLLEFCGYCGRENSLIGAAFGSVFTLGGLAMVIYGWHLHRTDSASTTEESGLPPV